MGRGDVQETSARAVVADWCARTFELIYSQFWSLQMFNISHIPWGTPQGGWGPCPRIFVNFYQRDLCTCPPPPQFWPLDIWPLQTLSCGGPSDIYRYYLNAESGWPMSSSLEDIGRNRVTLAGSAGHPVPGFDSVHFIAYVY